MEAGRPRRCSSSRTQLADTISAPLRDRMEMIDIPGYTPADKAQIVRDFLLPKRSASTASSRRRSTSRTTPSRRSSTATPARPASVRSSDRSQASPEDRGGGRQKQVPKGGFVVTPESLSDHLGPERFERESANRVSDSITTGIADACRRRHLLHRGDEVEGRAAQAHRQLGDVKHESAPRRSRT